MPVVSRDGEIGIGPGLDISGAEGEEKTVCIKLISRKTDRWFVMKHFYWDLFYIGSGNEQREEWQDSLVCPFDSLPLSQTALAGLKPTDHPAAASWYCSMLCTTRAVRRTVNRC